jgi:hypothetical protein
VDNLSSARGSENKVLVKFLVVNVSIWTTVVLRDKHLHETRISFIICTVLNWNILLSRWRAICWCSSHSLRNICSTYIRCVACLQNHGCSCDPFSQPIPEHCIKKLGILFRMEKATFLLHRLPIPQILCCLYYIL